jgi:hypothetical protein
MNFLNGHVAIPSMPSNIFFTGKASKPNVNFATKKIDSHFRNFQKRYRRTKPRSGGIMFPPRIPREALEPRSSSLVPMRFARDSEYNSPEEESIVALSLDGE